MLINTLNISAKVKLFNYIEVDFKQDGKIIMNEKSNVKVACNNGFAYEWIDKDGQRWEFVRPAYVDDDGGVPLDQLADGECVFSPGAIYRKKLQDGKNYHD